MNDTTRRFLNAVLSRVPESSLVEVRLFPAIRQGGIESGVAVLAVELDFAVPVEPPPPAVHETGDESPSPVEGSEVEVPIAHPVDAAMGVAEALLEVPAPAGPPRPPLGAHADPADDVLDELERVSALDVVAEGIQPLVETGAVDLRDPGEGEVDLVVSREPGTLDPAAESESIALGDILALPSPEVIVVGRPVGRAHKRLAILCARYRLVLKGPDRGKWDMDIIHQADAPLETLDRVIAGVIRRLGEVAEPERYSRERLRESLDAPAWAEGF